MIATPPTISEDVRRHRSDWIAAFWHRFEAGLEESTPLQNQPQKWNPKSDGRIDPRDGVLDPDDLTGGYNGPVCYETFLIPENRIGYYGENLILTSSDIQAYRRLLMVNKAHARAWAAYCGGNNYAIYRYRPSAGRVRPTTNAAANQLLQEVVLMFENALPCPPTAVREELAVA